MSSSDYEIFADKKDNNLKSKTYFWTKSVSVSIRGLHIKMELEKKLIKIILGCV